MINIQSSPTNQQQLTSNKAQSYTLSGSIVENKSYIPITGCVLEYILTTPDLSDLEKLYYLLADSLAIINSNSGKGRAVALPSEKWATRLNCSRSQIFAMQKSLSQKGYFIVNKEQNKIGQNKRNLIVPTLPPSVFNYLSKFPDRVGEGVSEPYNPLNECQRNYLDRTKLFIKLNYQLLNLITSNNSLTHLQKILWLSFYTKCYKNYIFLNKKICPSRCAGNSESEFSFISSCMELSSQFSCNKKQLSKSLKALEDKGFIRRKQFFVKKEHTLQDRQDQSLWEITLILPTNYSLEFENIKDRANLSLVDKLAVSNLKDNDLIIETIEVDVLGVTSLETDLICNQDIDSVMQELEEMEKVQSSSESTAPCLSSDNSNSDVVGAFSDPHVSLFRPLLNKDLKLNLKDIKSNLGLASKVLFDKFLKKFQKNDDNNNLDRKPKKEFNIYLELIRNKLKELPKDKADKARKFAYSLVSQKLATGYAVNLNKHELAKQLIYHAATWKPTKLGTISREKEIDAALAVAWKTIVAGTWQLPLELTKVQVLQYEFLSHKRKYQQSGVISNDVRSLELDVNKMLGRWYDLKAIITDECTDKYQIEASVDRQNDSLVNKNPEICKIEYEESPEIESLEESNNSQNNSYHGFSHGMKHTPIEWLDNPNYFVDYQNINLEHISEEERNLKITMSNQDNQVGIETIDGTVYFFKLKELDSSDRGDIVLTLRRDEKTKDLFLGKNRILTIHDQVFD